MDVQVIDHEHPRPLRVGGHRLLDVTGEVGLCPRRTDRRPEQFSGRHHQVADPAQRPVLRVLELDPLALPRDHRLAGGVPFQRLQTGHLVHAHRVGLMGPLLLGRREVRVADPLHLLLKPHGILLSGIVSAAAWH